MPQSHYEVLEVSPRASPETIRAAFRSLMQRHHPDRHAGDPQAVERARKLLHAYKVLSDPRHRADYDAQHEVRGATPSNTAQPDAPGGRAPACAATPCSLQAAGLMEFVNAVTVALILMLAAAAAWLHRPADLAVAIDLLRDYLPPAKAPAWRGLTPGEASILVALLAPASALLFMKRRILVLQPLVAVAGFAMARSMMGAGQ